MKLSTFSSLVALYNYTITQTKQIGPSERLSIVLHGADANEVRDRRELQNTLEQEADRILSLFKASKSQIFQDLFVCCHLNFKRDGYFVEFGATNGLDFSNTYLLEKQFGWQGIVAEPAVCWQTDLKKNRNCHVDTSCVYTNSFSKVLFRETNQAELSTIETFVDSDYNREKRSAASVYEVNTISLNDLLHKYDAPKHINYLSIDTEGTEFDILSHLNFREYTFDVITCEHNFSPLRDGIYELLTSKGYRRVFTELSRWDDWYVRFAN